jgi:hypothetical protein
VPEAILKWGAQLRREAQQLLKVGGTCPPVPNGAGATDIVIIYTVAEPLGRRRIQQLTRRPTSANAVASHLSSGVTAAGPMINKSQTQTETGQHVHCLLLAI